MAVALGCVIPCVMKTPSFLPLAQLSDQTLFGPFQLPSGETGVLFECYDSFSFQDWGKMPDPLPQKGAAQALLAAECFELLGSPSLWKRFSATPRAFQLRKANPFGSLFNEVGELLQQRGLRTHYRGVLPEFPEQASIHPVALSDLKAPMSRFVAQQVFVRKPKLTPFLGEYLYDYYPTRDLTVPRVFPFDVVFRVTEAFPKFDFYTQYEHKRRLVQPSEALAMSGLAVDSLQSIFLQSAWVAAFLSWLWKEVGLSLAEGLLTWGVNSEGELFLVGSLGLETLTLWGEGGAVFSQEALLKVFYHKHGWFAQAIEKSRKEHSWKADWDWRKKILLPPPVLSPEQREWGSLVYQVLAQSIAQKFSGRTWFQGLPPWSEIFAAFHRLSASEPPCLFL